MSKSGSYFQDSVELKQNMPMMQTLPLKSDLLRHWSLGSSSSKLWQWVKPVEQEVSKCPPLKNHGICDSLAWSRKCTAVLSLEITEDFTAVTSRDSVGSQLTSPWRTWEEWECAAPGCVGSTCRRHAAGTGSAHGSEECRTVFLWPCRSILAIG